MAHASSERSRGTGPTLLWTHGFMMPSAGEDTTELPRLWDRLKDWRVVRYDRVFVPSGSERAFGLEEVRAFEVENLRLKERKVSRRSSILP